MNNSKISRLVGKYTMDWNEFTESDIYFMRSAVYDKIKEIEENFQYNEDDNTSLENFQKQVEKYKSQLIKIEEIENHVIDNKVNINRYIRNNISSNTSESEVEKFISKRFLTIKEWNEIFKVRVFSKDFIERYIHKIDVDELSAVIDLDISKKAIINSLSSYLNWEVISCRKDITELFVREYIERLDLMRIIENSIPFSKNFLIDLIMYLDKSIEPYKRNILSSLIEKYKDYIDWDGLSKNGNLSFQFVETYIDSINWFYVSSYYPLNIVFFEKFKNYIDWNSVSNREDLSIRFVNQFKEYLNWLVISSKIRTINDSSIVFIRTFRDYIRWDILTCNIFEEDCERYLGFVKEFEKYIDWKEVSKNNLSIEFLRTFEDSIDWKVFEEYNCPTREIVEIFDSKLSKEYKKEFKRKVKHRRNTVFFNCFKSFLIKFVILLIVFTIIYETGIILLLSDLAIIVTSILCSIWLVSSFFSKKNKANLNE